MNSIFQPLALAPITSTYTTFFVGLNFCLDVACVRARIKTQVKTGDRDPKAASPSEDPLFQAVRAQGNFIEHVPLVLIASILAELNGASPLFLHTVLGLLASGRVLHFIGITRKGAGGIGRKYGTMATLAATLTLGVRLLTLVARL